MLFRSKWNKFVSQIKDDSRYLNMLGQTGSMPKELFDEFISSEKETFKQQKGTLKQIIKTGTIDLNSKMTFQEFDTEFGKYPEYSKIEEKNRKFLHEYVVAKVKEKEQETLKKYTKALKKYETFVKSLEGVTKNSKYEDFKEIIDKKEKFAIIPEDERNRRFYDHVLRLNDKSPSISEESGAIEKPKKDKKKKRHHSRSHSRSSSDHEKKKKHRHDSSEEHERKRSGDDHRRRSKYHDRRGKDDKSRDESRSRSRHKGRDDSRNRSRNPDRSKNYDKKKDTKTKEKIIDKNGDKVIDKNKTTEVTTEVDSKQISKGKESSSKS